MTTIKDIYDASGMSIKAFSEYFGIPYRTVQNWLGSVRQCPGYLVDLMRYKLSAEGIIK